MSAENERTISHCQHCRGEIYAGDEVMRVTGDSAVVHSGYPYKCAQEYAVSIVYDAVGTITVRGEIE